MRRVDAQSWPNSPINGVELTELHRFANTPVQLPTGLYWDTLRLFHEICEGIRAAEQG